MCCHYTTGPRRGRYSGLRPERRENIAPVSALSRIETRPTHQRSEAAGLRMSKRPDMRAGSGGAEEAGRFGWSALRRFPPLFRKERERDGYPAASIKIHDLRCSRGLGREFLLGHAHCRKDPNLPSSAPSTATRSPPDRFTAQPVTKAGSFSVRAH